MIGRRIRPVLVATSLAAALAVPVALAAATPALASHGKPGRTCTLTSSSTLDGVTVGHPMKVPAEDAGTVTLKRDDVNDGLVVGRVVPAAGWSSSVEIKTGPKVDVQFRNGSVKKEFEAAQSAQYYGPDVLVIEVKTCV